MTLTSISPKPGIVSTQLFSIHPTQKFHRSPRAPPSQIPLHTLDHAPPLHMRNHMFFHRPQSETPEVVINKLKTSLAEALELFPPVAGVVQAREDELCIIIDSSAEGCPGTPFLVEMRDAVFAGHMEELSPRPEMVLPPGASTFAVKVTQFSCGTIAICASMHHQVVDLSGYLEFLAIWALLARGEPINLTDIPDDWSRSPGRFFSDYDLNTKQSTEIPAPPPPPPGWHVLPTLPATEPSPAPASPGIDTKWKFTNDAVERLKKDFSPSAGSKDLWVSSGDALAALIWGAITRARNASNTPPSRAFGDPQGGSISERQTDSEVLAMAADGRTKFPEKQEKDKDKNMKYFGNLNFLPSITASRTDLLSPTAESASRVAFAIRNALTRQLSPEAILHKLAFFEDPRNSKPLGRIGWTADVVMTNWCKFDFHGARYDFGWGKPFLVTTATGSKGAYPPGYVVLMREGSEGAQDCVAMVTVERQALGDLKEDLLLNKYAELVEEDAN